MNFQIYYHNDFDGIASAGLFSKFLDLKYDIEFGSIGLSSVDYNLKSRWVESKVKRPCAVLDFLYHPDCDWWFDHHSEPFSFKAFNKQPFVPGEKKAWSPNFLSCPSLIVSHLYKHYRKQSISLKKEYAELLKWSDIIDGAKYTSPKEYFDNNSKYMNLNRTLELSSDESYYSQVIESIYNNQIDKFSNSDIFQKYLTQYHQRQDEIINIYKKIIKIDGDVAYIDQSEYSFPFQRYLPFYFYPEISYCISILQSKNNYKVSINYNAWKTQKNRVNIGQLCNKSGGGGRANVGGIISGTYNEALKAALSIKELLKNSQPKQLSLFKNILVS